MCGPSRVNAKGWVPAQIRTRTSAPAMRARPHKQQIDRQRAVRPRVPTARRSDDTKNHSLAAIRLRTVGVGGAPRQGRMA